MRFSVSLALVAVVTFLFCSPAYSIPSHPESEEEIQNAFGHFMSNFGKVYATVQMEKSRFAIFRENLKTIKMLNEKHGPNTVFGITQFSDLTPEEFQKQFLTLKTVPKAEGPVAPLYSKEVINNLPTNFDWRDKGAVTPVKNQGMCGSCWAFSTTGNVEGQWFLAGHNLTSLSEQNLVDCDHECSIYEGQQECDSGCNGGLMQNAFQYIIKNNGIATEAAYPYEGYDAKCRYDPGTKGAHISNWTFISHDEDQMAAYLVEKGPIAIAADATLWQFYYFGVFNFPCGTELNHGILIVGYGEETDYLGAKIKYWIVKNSWGTMWGRSGYLYIVRGVGACGINLYPSTAIINK